jgi:hypothetical protein
VKTHSYSRCLTSSPHAKRCETTPPRMWQLLEAIWIEKLTPYGEQGYNERKKDRDELLSSMAERRSRRP